MEQERISEAPWNGDKSNFSDSQYEAACALDRKSCGSEWADKPPKTRCSLPYKTPNGELSRAGTHAAAGRVGSVTDACPGAVAAAKSKLRAAYKTLGEDPPPALREIDELEDLAREYGVVPGEARHGQVAMRAQSDGDNEFRTGGEEDGYIGTLHGHFAVFNRWTEINSLFEGRFMEQIAPGAFKKTFEENRKGMRCLLQHGRDPQVGMKPLGPIRELEEDDFGGRYEVPLFDASYNRDLVPALKDGQYGASFRFVVVREEVDSEPKRSEGNPEGIEERTITEAKVREFGPVTFPAYADATAGVRSLNDWWLDLDLELFRHAHPDAYPGRLAELLISLRAKESSSQERESEVEESAPPPRAPDAGIHRPRTTRLPGAARKPLKTSSKEDTPIWKL